MCFSNRFPKASAVSLGGWKGSSFHSPPAASTSKTGIRILYLSFNCWSEYTSIACTTTTVACCLAIELAAVLGCAPPQLACSSRCLAGTEPVPAELRAYLSNRHIKDSPRYCIFVERVLRLLCADRASQALLLARQRTGTAVWLLYEPMSYVFASRCVSKPRMPS